jgi:hypothetical protein
VPNKPCSVSMGLFWQPLIFSRQSINPLCCHFSQEHLAVPSPKSILQIQ